MPTIGNYANKSVATAQQEANDSTLHLKIVTLNGLRDPLPDEAQDIVASNGAGYAAGTTVAANSDVGVNLSTA